MTEWNEIKLKEYLTSKIEENQHLEYKSAKALDKTDKKKTEISITVSSMANADGGIIFYGMKEYDEPDKKHLPEKIDPIEGQVFSKEWLEQIINSNIYPTIQNLLIHPVIIESVSNDVVYVIEVPKSFTAHQAKDLRYYRRYNFATNPMYDYEIKDILNRNQTPNLDLYFVIERITRKKQDISILPGISFTPEQDRKKKPEFYTYVKIKIVCKNEGRILANYINCEIDIPEKFILKNTPTKLKIFDKEGINYVKKFGDNTTREIIGHSGTGMFSVSNYGPARYEPLLPRTENHLFSIELADNVAFEEGKLYWTLYTDNAEPKIGECLMKDIRIEEIFEDR